jgi:hypothetical protein
VGEIVDQFIASDRASAIAAEHAIDLASVKDRAIRTRLAWSHGDLHGGNVLVRQAKDPLLIDYGDIGERSAIADPVTLELSLFSHPSALKTITWRPSQAARWHSADEFFDGAPIGEYLRIVRKWTREVAFGDHDVSANVLGYALRQLKYRDVEKALFVALANQMVEALQTG